MSLKSFTDAVAVKAEGAAKLATALAASALVASVRSPALPGRIADLNFLWCFFRSQSSGLLDGLLGIDSSGEARTPPSPAAGLSIWGRGPARAFSCTLLGELSPGFRVLIRLSPFLRLPSLSR